MENDLYLPTHEIEVRVCISKTVDGNKSIDTHLALKFCAFSNPDFNKIYSSEFKAEKIMDLAKEIANKIKGE